MINGRVEFYDEPSAWGLIRGDDGRLYDLRGAQLGGPVPQVGERVLFEPQPAPGGPRAAAVRRLNPAPAPRGAARP
jgi:cold shock CspA family protein